MPKRKVVEEDSDEGSDLSPPPDGLLNGGQAVAGANGHADEERPTKKRQARAVKSETLAETPAEANGSIDTDKPVKKRTRKQKVNVEVVEDEEVGEPAQDDESAPKKKRRRKAAEVKEKDEQELDENGEVVEKKVKKKRKTKAEKEAELVEMPLAQRTIGHKLYIGAHVSSAGGVHQSVLNSVHVGANAFALFLKSQRKWANPPLQDDHCETFHAHCKHHTYDQGQHVVPHGSYLVNLAHTSSARTAQAFEAFVDDLKRCERLGISLYNFHPGNDQCGDRQKSIAHLAANVNRAHAETTSVVTLLENMAAGGNVLGSTFEDLRDIIALIRNKARIGVCLDTCHAFAAGYDLRTPTAFKQTMDHFDEVVGMKYLRALHINDSKAPFQSHKDLHANIGTGFLGLRAFHNIVNEPRFAGLPLVLETPIDVRDEQGNYVKNEKGTENKEDKSIWAREIKMLESLLGMDAESEDFVKMEADLQQVGAPERRRLLEQIERVAEKKAKKAEGKKRRGKKAGASERGSEEGGGEESSLSELDEEDGIDHTQKLGD